jgi:hypothetical protein
MSILKNILIATDQLVNCLIRIDGEWGTPDETLSARAWRIREAHSCWHVLIDRLFFWDSANGKSHCQLSFEVELSRGHLPRVYGLAGDKEWKV